MTSLCHRCWGCWFLWHRHSPGDLLLLHYNACSVLSVLYLLKTQVLKHLPEVISCVFKLLTTYVVLWGMRQRMQHEACGVGSTVASAIFKHATQGRLHSIPAPRTSVSPTCPSWHLVVFAMKSLIFFRSSFPLVTIKRYPLHCHAPLSQASNNTREDLQPLCLLASA